MGPLPSIAKGADVGGTASHFLFRNKATSTDWPQNDCARGTPSCKSRSGAWQPSGPIDLKLMALVNQRKMALISQHMTALVNQRKMAMVIQRMTALINQHMMALE